MKKIICAMLALLTVLCMVPMMAVSASAAPAITVDGDLSDWAGVHTLSVVGSGEWEGKKVTIYGVLGEDGLYMAADAYHAKFTTDQGDWWMNTNFEFFVNKNGNRDNQCWVSAKGYTADNPVPTTSHEKMVAKMTNEKVGDLYHTTVEVFMAYSDFDFLATGEDDFLRIGVAWKTIGDVNNNGEANGGGNDEYWVPKLTWPANADKAHVTANGIFNRNGEALENTEVVGAKDATEDEEGYTGDTVCKDCGAVVAKGESIPVKTPETDSPKTGDALNVALALSVVALALSVSLAFKKRTVTE
ncbi:MAG: TFIIB-type zinc ribbon-containing protein [Clostridia bacterium]|nr:TFIIB-type zinc ribbon-containing protein [Clostridia bacterium]